LIVIERRVGGRQSGRDRHLTEPHRRVDPILSGSVLLVNADLSDRLLGLRNCRPKRTLHAKQRIDSRVGDSTKFGVALFVDRTRDTGATVEPANPRPASVDNAPALLRS